MFIVGHELIHRRSLWERRVGEFLLASASYPQYATEHIYIHHALVGMPMDLGSAPKGQSIWNYFPHEVASNLTGAWRVERERLARRGLAVWHYTNPFWRYAIETGAWYALIYWMGGIWAILVFAALCLVVVFSMKLSNHIQHYGLRRVRLPSGRFERTLPRHSWSANYKSSNWMFYNTQRHPDHHAASNRRFPVLQHCGEDDSPQLPGSYGKLFWLAVFPSRWFRKIDPLVDEWRARFYPGIEDWSAYDSPAFAARPDSFEAIDEIFGIAPRLVRWIDRAPELLDTLQDREFTDLDLPRGFGPDPEAEAIARRGLARLYWTHEYSISEMRQQIADVPVVGLDDSIETVRNWSNGKAFQIGVHTLRGNLSPIEAGTALSNIAEASIASVLAAVAEDFAERRGARTDGGLAAAVPGAAIDMLFVHDGGEAVYYESLCREFADALRALSERCLVFAPGGSERPVRSLARFEELGHDAGASGELLDLTRARCIFTAGDPTVGVGFDAARRAILADGAARDALIADLRKPSADAPEPRPRRDRRHEGRATRHRARRPAPAPDARRGPAESRRHGLRESRRGRNDPQRRHGAAGRRRPAMAQPAGCARPRGRRRRGGGDPHKGGRVPRTLLRLGRFRCAHRRDPRSGHPRRRGHRGAGGDRRELGGERLSVAFLPSVTRATRSQMLQCPHRTRRRPPMSEPITLEVFTDYV